MKKLFVLSFTVLLFIFVGCKKTELLQYEGYIISFENMTNDSLMIHVQRAGVWAHVAPHGISKIINTTILHTPDVINTEYVVYSGNDRMSTYKLTGSVKWKNIINY